MSLKHLPNAHTQIESGENTLPKQKLPWSTPRLFDLTQGETASGTFEADTETKYDPSTGLFHLYAPVS
jgi:hypothetical protein